MINKAYIVAGSGNSYSVRVPTLDKVKQASLGNSDLAEAMVSSPFKCDSDLRPNDSVFIEYEDRNYASPVIIGYLESGRDTGTSLRFDSIEVSNDSNLPFDTSIGDITNEEISFLKNTDSNIEGQISLLNNSIENIEENEETLKNKYEENLDLFENLSNFYEENVSKTDDIETILGNEDDSDDSTVYGRLNKLSEEINGANSKIGEVPSGTNVLDIILNLKSRLQKLIDSAPKSKVNPRAEQFNPTIDPNNYSFDETDSGTGSSGNYYNNGGNSFGKSGSIDSAISMLRSKFPHGAYWNHAPTEGNLAYNGVNNQDGYTYTPCPKHGNCGSSTQTCNGYAPYGSELAWQCFGYAFKCGYDASGSDPSSWSKSYSTEYLKNLKKGDIIRYKGHSVFVIDVSGTSVTVTDCNSDGHCQIQWDKCFSRDHFSTNFEYVAICPI